MTFSKSKKNSINILKMRTEIYNISLLTEYPHTIYKNEKKVLILF